MSSEPRSGPEASSSFRLASEFAAWITPRALVDTYRAARRDVAFVLDGFAGRRPPSFTTRRAAAPTSALSGALSGRAVRITRVTRETDDAVTIEFIDPTGAPFVFAAGQFVTVVCSLGGREYRRAYSLSSSPLDAATAAITVKRVRDGAVSNHLNDRASVGDTLHLLGPSGSFTLAVDPSAARHRVLIAGGSGITPVISIARTALRAEPSSRVWLVYGNRRAQDVIFRDALDALVAEHPGRFVVRHVLSDPPDDFQGARGMLDGATLCAELDALGPVAPDAEYYLCGPEAMMRAAREALLARGVGAARLREERFSQPHLRVSEPGGGLAAQRVLFTVPSGVEREAIVAPGQTLLEAGLGAGVAMPYSCAMGGCGACRVRVVSGDVTMEEPNCLAADERSQGYVLACVARPGSGVKLEVPG